MDKERIRAYETKYHVCLPDEYINFLLQNNGGLSRQDLTINLENDVCVLCDCLFGLGLEDQFDLNFWQDEFAGELPEDCAVIGSSPGGGFFLLLKQNEQWKIFYYDHSYDFASSSDEYNTYECSIEPKQFLALVVRPFRA